MKKLFLLFALSILTSIVFAQNPVLVYRYATPTTQLGRTLVDGNVIIVRSTGQMIEVTKTFTATATPASVITDGHSRVYPYASTGISSLTPATTGAGTIGTSSLKFLYGYINGFVNKDSIIPATTGTGYIGTSTHHFGIGYINALYATSLTIGAQALTRKDANGLTLPHSLTTIDSIFTSIVQCDRTNATVVAANNVNASYLGLTASDTTTKTAGRVVYLNGHFWGANGTKYIKLDN